MGLICISLFLSEGIIILLIPWFLNNSYCSLRFQFRYHLLSVAFLDSCKISSVVHSVWTCSSVPHKWIFLHHNGLFIYLPPLRCVESPGRGQSISVIPNVISPDFIRVRLALSRFSVMLVEWMTSSTYLCYVPMAATITEIVFIELYLHLGLIFNCYCFSMPKDGHHD